MDAGASMGSPGRTGYTHTKDWEEMRRDMEGLERGQRIKNGNVNKFFYEFGGGSAGERVCVCGGGGYGKQAVLAPHATRPCRLSWVLYCCLGGSHFCLPQ